MIDFSAFPERRPKGKVWLISLAVFVALCLTTSLVLLALPNDASRMFGWALFQIITSSIVTVLMVVLVIIPIWFVRRVIVPRVRGVAEGTLGAQASAYNGAILFEQFASDNGFKYQQYPLQSPAPVRLYEALYKTVDKDSVYLLYQVAGTYSGTDFALYCLAFAEGRFPGLVSRRGHAYAHDSDGRRIEYATVLMLPGNISLRRKGILKTIHHNTDTFIYSGGYLADRKTLKDMFAELDH